MSYQLQSLCFLSSILLLTTLENPERKTLFQIIPTNGKTRLKVEFAVTFFTTINLFFVGEHLTRSGEVENSEMIKKILKRQLFYSFLFLFLFFFISVLEWLPFFRKRLHFLCSMLYYLFVQDNVQTSMKGKILYSFEIDKLYSVHSKVQMFDPPPRVHLFLLVFAMSSPLYVPLYKNNT